MQFPLPCLATVATSELDFEANTNIITSSNTNTTNKWN